jgi:uncharacterized protein (DUF1697 family)
MTTVVALLRGVNVGGRHSLPMKELRVLLGELGCENVKTYIQSGNAVFNTSANPGLLSQDITAAIERQFGFAPSVFLLTFDEYQSILGQNPFPDAVSEPKSIHIGFVTEQPSAPDLETIESLKSATENYQLLNGAFWLHAPDGIGRSKLAAKIDKCLGVATTGRNWRSAKAIEDLAATIIS